MTIWIPFRVLCLTLVGLSLWLRPTSVWSQAATEEIQFDTLEIEALNLAFDAKKWVSDVTPEPTVAFGTLIHTRPMVLVARERGKIWLERPIGTRSLVSIDLVKFALQPGDLDAAEKLLTVPFIIKWTACMRDAIAGSASDDCLADLVKLAQAEQEPTRSLLLANLGARILSLGPRNQQWQDSLQKSLLDPSTPAAKAIAAYSQVEAEKVVAVFNLSKLNSSSSKFVYSGNVCVENGSVQESQSWSDFVAAIQNKGSGALKKRIVIWSFGKEGKLIPNNDQRTRASDAAIATYVLTPDQHVILKGQVNEQILDAIQEANNFDELIQTSEKFKLQPFLSRPGSATVFALDYKGKGT